MSHADRHPASPRLSQCPEGLPKAAYFDAGWYGREMTTIFARQWVMVGRAATSSVASLGQPASISSSIAVAEQIWPGVQ